MAGIRNIVAKGREILEVDFSNCKDAKMIDVLMDARKLLINGKKKQLVLALFNEKNFLTPKFMEHFRSDQREEAIAVIERQAIVGFNEVKRQIINGYNIIYNRNMQMFDTKEEAIDFLLNS